MTYKTHGKYLFTNSQELTLKTWDDEKLYFTDGLVLDISYTTSFKPAYAMTVHKSQGSTIDRKYSIYEYKQMTPRMLYVALTRTTKQDNVSFCEIETDLIHTGYIYGYELNGKFYIGSTKNLNKRKQEHRDCIKAGDTKFNRAIKTHGFNKFNYKVLETIKYSNINELWRLEDEYIDLYDSINNGYNIRHNIKSYI
jgi:ATP-dependent exoDNAse (exonuclease V) alpha subunit